MRVSTLFLELILSGSPLISAVPASFGVSPVLFALHSIGYEPYAEPDYVNTWYVVGYRKYKRPDCPNAKKLNKNLDTIPTIKTGVCTLLGPGGSIGFSARHRSSEDNGWPIAESSWLDGWPIYENLPEETTQCQDMVRTVPAMLMWAKRTDCKEDTADMVLLAPQWWDGQCLNFDSLAAIRMTCIPRNYTEGWKRNRDLYYRPHHQKREELVPSEAQNTTTVEVPEAKKAVHDSAREVESMSLLNEEVGTIIQAKVERAEELVSRMPRTAEEREHQAVESEAENLVPLGNILLGEEDGVDGDKREDTCPSGCHCTNLGVMCPGH